MNRLHGLILGLGLLLLGCGTNRIIIGVDIASFFTPEMRSASYGGPVPLPPATEVTVPILAQTVVTPRGLDEVSSVEEADLEIRASFDNLSGQASGSVEVFLAPEGEDPYDEDPVGSFPFTLRAGEVSVTASRVVVDPEQHDLFLDGKFEVGIRITLMTQGADPVYGSYEIEVLKARVVTDPNLGG